MTPLRLLLLSPLVAASVLAQVSVPGDANADGVLNAADHAFVQAILNRRLEPTTAADVDGDGQVTAIDATAVADLILGQMPFLAVGSGELPTGGGTVTAGDLTIIVADGALPTAAQIVVTAANQPASFEGDDDSPLYRIEGIPTRHDVGITFSLPPTSAGRTPSREGEAVLEVGEMISLSSTAEPYLALSVVPTRLENGRLVADLAKPDVPPVGRDEEVPATRTVVVRRITGVASDADTLPEEDTGRGAGIPIIVYKPAKMTVEQYQPMKDALRAAISKLKKLGFSPADRTTPIYIYLKKLPAGTCGYYVGSALGVDSSSLEINISYVTDPAELAELQRTVFHEYFHMIQSRFDPRYSFTKAKYNAPQLWFDEACSVWFEKYAPAVGLKTSSYMDSNAGEVLAGHHMDCTGLAFLNDQAKTKAQDHGYGLSLMLEFLFSNPEAPADTLDKANPTLVNIYTALLGGTGMREAFLAGVPPVTGWWDDMLQAFANGTIGDRIAFGSRISARMTSVKLDAALKSPGLKTVDIVPLGDCESWVIGANWQGVGAKPGRRLVVEVASPDNALFSRALNSARNQTNPVAAEGTSFGKYGNWFVSWLMTPMESTNNGLDIRPIHYVILRHFGNAVPAAAATSSRLWYVDSEVPVHTVPMKETWDAVAPKLIDYSLNGTATSEDALQTHETVLYDSAALTHVVSRGGASFLVPNEGAYQVQVEVQLRADIPPESLYLIKQYRVRIYYHDSAGEVREEYPRTYPSPGTDTNISLLATLGANDRHAFVDVYADEDFKSGAVLESNVPYSTRSWFSIGTISRYEPTLESRYGKRDGTRSVTLPPACVRQGVLRKGGVSTAVPLSVQPAPAPAATTGAE